MKSTLTACALISISALATPIVAAQGQQTIESAGRVGRGAADSDRSSRVDIGPYFADLQRRIKRAWFPPKGNESKRVVVSFTVGLDGTTSNIQVTGPSDYDIANKAAVKAIENASPFRPLPSGSKKAINIEFTFDFGRYNGGGKAKLSSEL